jgi:K+-transporting ATPase c subunit
MTSSINPRPIDLFLSTLDKVKAQGKGWIACCPAHNDRTPSLSISEAEDGTVLFRCFAGCKPADVVSGARLEWSSLFPGKLSLADRLEHERKSLAAARAKAELLLELAEANASTLDDDDLLIAAKAKADLPRINARIAEMDGGQTPQGFEEISQSESGLDDVDLLNPPGLSGEICRYIAAGARRPRPEIYPFAALHLMALAGRERRSVFTRKLNLITLAIAPTAAGKERPQDAVKRLAHTVKCSNLIHGNAGSFKDLIYNLLEGDGASLYIVDEVHSLFDSMKSKNAQSYESKMEAEILTMSSTELYTFRGMEKRQLATIYRAELQAVTKKLDSGELEDAQASKLDAVCKRVQQRINWLEDGMPDPFFSLMGHSVPERLDSFVSASNIDSGFIGRALVMRCPETREKLRRTESDAGMQAMLEVSITEGLHRIQSSRLVIPADDDAAEYLSKAIDWYDEDEQLNHPLVGGIYARAPEHLYRVSTILALNKGTITLEHARYAHALVKQSIADVKHIMLKAHTESGSAADAHVKEHARQTIHRNCKGQGQTLSRLRQIIEKPKGWQGMQRKEPTRDLFNELLSWMLDKAEIERITTGRRERIKSRAVV